MKKILLMAVFALAMAFDADAGEPLWHDASEFPLYGKISDATNSRYERLPGSLEGVSRDAVWRLGRCSAGLYIRFRAKTMYLYVKWEPLYDRHMEHMTDTGVKGLDLYGLTENDGWQYVRCAIPKGNVCEAKLGCDRQEREYMLYLPLYDGLKSLSIGVDEDGYIGQPEIESPSHAKPIIMYGSSILQGCSASRPGMAHTNILARRLDREVINLGFSGNAKLDYDIAELMASYEDPGLFVLDYVPNASAEQIEERAENFYRIIRDSHPSVPVVFVEVPYYPPTKFNRGAMRIQTGKNVAQKKLFENLRKSGEKNIWYVNAEGIIGYDNDATVDGTHFTDAGMIRYVEHILPTIKKAMKIK